MTKKSSAQMGNNSTLVKKPKRNQNRDQETSFAKSSWLSEYIDATLTRITPLSETIVNNLAQELTDWVRLPDKLTFTSFLVHKKIPRDTFYRWAEEYPQLKTAHQLALMSLSDRREVGGLTRKFDPAFVLNSMPMYDPAWKEFMQWKASLKQDDGNQQKVVVEINDLSLKGKE